MRQRVLSVTHYLRHAALAIGVLALTACASSPNRQGAEAQAPRIDPTQPVVVALLAPTTAQNERVRRAAQDLVAAAQQARSERAPETLVLKIYDTKGSTAGAASAASRALADGAGLILGPMLGSSAKAAGPVAAKRDVNVISFSTDASIGGGNVWVLGQTANDELSRLMSYAGARGLSSVAVAYPTNRAGQVVASEAGNAGQAAGVSVGPFFAYERSVEGITGAAGEGAAAIGGSGVGGVLIADRGDALRFVAKSFATNGVSPSKYRYLGLSQWDERRNFREASMSGAWFISADPAKKAVFERRFASNVGRGPHPVARFGYDAVAAAAAMLDDAAAGGLPAFERRAITRERGFEGAAGWFRLTSEGLNRRGLAVMGVSSGGARVIDPAPSGAPGS